MDTPRRRTTQNVRIPRARTGAQGLPNSAPQDPSGAPPVPGARPTTGMHPLPGARRTTGMYSVPGHPQQAGHLHHPPPRKSSSGSGLLIGIFIAVAAAGTIYWFTRDTWEQDHRAYVLELKHDAQTARAANLRSMAFRKYDAIDKAVKNHALKDPVLVDAYNEARTQMPLLLEEMEKEQEQGGGTKATKSAAEIKAHDLEYSKYLAKAEGILEALQRANTDVDNKADLAKYKDDLKEIELQYNRWFDALSGEEVAYPSQRLIKLARDGFIAGGNWWSIETDKKMPEALYANAMRRNEWSMAGAMMTRIKDTIAAKDVVDRKTCGPCDGTGRLKCPICLGSGICQFCKGKGDPVLKCCLNGVCDACKGRKDSECAICRGTGKFPPTPIGAK